MGAVLPGCSLLAIAVVVFVPRDVPTILVMTLGGLVALAGLYAATRLFRSEGRL